MEKVAESCLRQLFLDARTHNKWQDRPVLMQTLHEVYDLMKLGPTSANCAPLRILFLTSENAKERLRPHLSPGNVDKTMLAPVVAILAYDTHFYEHLPHLFPFAQAKPWFDHDQNLADTTAFRNSSLQGGYFILAARACGLDCGPMSGFSHEGLDKEFFPEGRFKSNFLCNLAYGDPSGLPGPRAPRLSFDEACKIL